MGKKTFFVITVKINPGGGGVQGEVKYSKR
jgi:hypothetical protein